MGRYKKRSAVGLCLAAMALTVIWGAQSLLWAAQPEEDQDLVTIAGMPGNGYRDGMGNEARFAGPTGLDVKDRAVVIADTENNLIRSLSGQRVITTAGSRKEENAYGNGLGAFMDSNHSRAMLDGPVDCVYMDNGNIAIADRNNHAIRIVGKSWVFTLNGTGVEGYEEGKPGQAKFSYPSGIAKGLSGKIYVADTGNHCIRVIDRNGVTSLVAGVPGQAGLKDGEVSEALFMEPTALVMAEDGSVYVADSGNQRIRRIKDGQVTTVAGGAWALYLDTQYRQPGSADGDGAAARFWFPEGICMAGDVVIVADTGNHVVRAISPLGRVRTIAGNGEAGFLDGSSEEGMLNRPCDVAWEDGTLYIMDTGNCALRTIEFDPDQWLNELGEQ